MSVDWTMALDIEVIADKVSGAPLLKNTRIPADAIISNYESALHRGMTFDQAVAEVSEDYPAAGVERIKRVLDFYHSHQVKARP